jgi:hypothetical protein
VGWPPEVALFLPFGSSKSRQQAAKTGLQVFGEVVGARPFDWETSVYHSIVVLTADAITTRTSCPRLTSPTGVVASLLTRPTEPQSPRRRSSVHGQHLAGNVVRRRSDEEQNDAFQLTLAADASHRSGLLDP